MLSLVLKHLLNRRMSRSEGQQSFARQARISSYARWQREGRIAPSAGIGAGYTS